MTPVRLALFDIDGTLTAHSVWDVLLRHPRLGPPAKRAAMARALPAWLGVKLRLWGDDRFRDVWVGAFARRFRGWPRAQVDDMFAWLVREMIGGFRPDVTARLRGHVESGDTVLLVTGMYDGIAAGFARELGAAAGVGTKLAYHGDVCQGRLDGRPIVGARKLNAVAAYLKAHDLTADRAASSAYADSESDLPLLGSVGRPVATYPDAALRAHAAARGWEIIGQGR